MLYRCTIVEKVEKTALKQQFSIIICVCRNFLVILREFLGIENEGIKKVLEKP